MSAVDVVLENTPMDANVTPEQLVEMIQVGGVHQPGQRTGTPDAAGTTWWWG